MSFIQQKAKLWPVRNAAFIGQTASHAMLLKEILPQTGWKIEMVTQHIEEVFAGLQAGKITLLIIEDHPDMPSAIVLRQMISDPIAILTPTIAFLSERMRSERDGMLTLGKPEIIGHPLTPAKFVPSFQSLQRTWERDAFRIVRQAVSLITSGNEAAGLGLLAKVSGNVEVQTSVAISLALYYRRLGDSKTAEKLLLSALKKEPMHLGAMLSLGETYMFGSMPNLAHRLYTTAHTAFGQSMIVRTDLSQACLVAGKIDEAVRHVTEIVKQDFILDTAVSWLTKLLLAEGRENEIEKIINKKKSTIAKIRNAWIEFEKQAAAPAAPQPAATPAAS